MRSPSVAMLFVPSRLPLRLDEGRIFVLGRSPDCDLAVASGRASRRHAHVFWERTGYVVVDLSSTNGTYVNGERIRGKRALHAGDSILVGDQAVTFCQIGAEQDLDLPGEDSDTVVYAAPPPEAEDALQGDLREIPAFAVLQLLEMGRKSGRLAVLARGAEHQVWLAAGRLVHAESGLLRGRDAAVVFAQERDGRFAFHPGEQALHETLSSSVTELLLEASRRHDETLR